MPRRVAGAGVGTLTRRAILARLGAGAMLCTAVGGCASAALLSPPADAVRLTRSSRNELIAPVRLNGVTDAFFKLDTGAAMSALYPGHGGLADPAGEGPEAIRVWGLGGTSVRPLRRIGRLALGGSLYLNYPVTLLVDRNAELNAAGILGMDVLKDWVIEAQTSTGDFLLYPAARKSWRRFRGWQDVALVEAPHGGAGYGLKFSWVKVWGKPVATLFDIGSELSIMNWEAARLIPDLRSYWTTAYDTWRYYGAVGSFSVSGMTELRDVRMGEHEWDTVEFLVTDLDALGLLGAGGRPLMIAGANMFADRDFVFDPAENLLQLRGRPPG